MGRTGNVPLGADYWAWKHIANPFGTSPVLTAHAAPPDRSPGQTSASGESRMAGLRTFMRWRWRSSAREVPSVRAVDTATHPDFRGRGVFKRLTLQIGSEMREEGVPFVYNTPNEMSRPGYVKMGCKVVGRVSLVLRPVRPFRLASRVLRQRLDRGNAPPEAPTAQESRRWQTMGTCVDRRGSWSASPRPTPATRPPARPSTSRGATTPS